MEPEKLSLTKGNRLIKKRFALLGKNAIYYTIDTKIASSLEEFVEKIIKEPDYFIEEI